MATQSVAKSNMMLTNSVKQYVPMPLCSAGKISDSMFNQHSLKTTRPAVKLMMQGRNGNSEGSAATLKWFPVFWWPLLLSILTQCHLQECSVFSSFFSLLERALWWCFWNLSHGSSTGCTSWNAFLTVARRKHLFTIFYSNCFTCITLEFYSSTIL